MVQLFKILPQSYSKEPQRRNTKALETNPRVDGKDMFYSSIKMKPVETILGLFETIIYLIKENVSTLSLLNPAIISDVSPSK